MRKWDRQRKSLRERGIKGEIKKKSNEGEILKTPGGDVSTKLGNEDKLCPSSCWADGKPSLQNQLLRRELFSADEMSNCENLESESAKLSVWKAPETLWWHLLFPSLTSRPVRPLCVRRGGICSTPSPLPTDTRSETPVACSTTWPVPSNTSTASTLCTETSNQRTCWWVDTERLGMCPCRSALRLFLRPQGKSLPTKMSHPCCPHTFSILVRSLPPSSSSSSSSVSLLGVFSSSNCSSSSPSSLIHWLWGQDVLTCRGSGDVFAYRWLSGLCCHIHPLQTKDGIAASCLCFVYYPAVSVKINTKRLSATFGTDTEENCESQPEQNSCGS